MSTLVFCAHPQCIRVYVCALLPASRDVRIATERCFQGGNTP